MIPTRFRRAEGACDLGYDELSERHAEDWQSVWWLGLIVAIFSVGCWFRRRPRPAQQ